MSKKTIRLKENDLLRIIQESINDTLMDTGMQPSQLRNATGIQDDDELNAAVFDEEGEDVEDQIFNAIKNDLCGGQNPRTTSVNFDDLTKLINNFGFEFAGIDDNDECYVFNGENRDLYIYPRNFYPEPSTITIFNMFTITT